MLARGGCADAGDGWRRDDAGTPVRGITVHAANEPMQDFGDDTSGDDGAFCIRYLLNEGTYEVTVSSGGQTLAPLTPVPPVAILDAHAEISIVLASPKSSIAGIVVDDAGAPLADVAVRARAEAAHGEPPRFDETSPLAVALTAVVRLQHAAGELLVAARLALGDLQQRVELADCWIAEDCLCPGVHDMLPLLDAVPAVLADQWERRRPLCGVAVSRAVDAVWTQRQLQLLR